MENLFIDIETIPWQEDRIRSLAEGSVKCPGTIKKKESKEAWESSEAKEKAIDEYYKSCALRGDLGQIVCICLYHGETMHSFVGDEVEILNRLNDHMRVNFGHYNVCRWVGYNVMFDIRFIWQRMMINNIKPLFSIPAQAKPWDNDIYDIMVKWHGVGFGSAKIKRSLKNLALSLGVIDEITTTGADVYDMWKEGRTLDIASYCCEDVRMCKDIYNIMNP